MRDLTKIILTFLLKIIFVSILYLTLSEFQQFLLNYDSFVSRTIYLSISHFSMSFLPPAPSVALQRDVSGSGCLAGTLRVSGQCESELALRSVTDSTANSRVRSALAAHVSSDANQPNSLRHDVFCQLLLWLFCKDFMDFCQLWKFAFILLAAFIFNDLSACL